MNKQKVIYPAVETMEGNAVTVKRLFPIRNRLMNYDPFVLWDHFKLSPNSGFPEHPHRGFEAITYLFEGSIEHKDNLGHIATVLAGGAQRFTAGKGIVHSETPAKDANSTGIQVWINLPRHLKQIDPTYQQVDAQDILEETADGVRIRTIVGDQHGIQLNTSVQYFDLLFERNTRKTTNIPHKHRGLVYVVQGEVNIDGQHIRNGNAYFFEQGISELELAGKENTRVMLISGIPHKQPIIQHGSFVD